MKNEKVAFVGGGNMARAITSGLLDSGFTASNILVSEPLAELRASLSNDLPGIIVSADNNEVAAAAGCVVLAVKPQILRDVCHSLRDTVQRERPLIVSLAAGTHGTDIDAWLGGGLSVVRAMPNQPALLRLGVSGLYVNDQTSAEERERATEIIGAVGSVVYVDSETDIDAVTAVSGSGPAYFYLLIDILINTAVELGITEETAQILAIETARGAAALADSESESMDTLIARVRSPGGTAAAALDSLENSKVRDIFSAAITVARDRATELAKGASKSGD